MKELVKIYFIHKTYVYLRELHPSGEVKWYNGFIIKLHDDFLIFQDRKISQPFPVLYESIIKLEPSEEEEEI